MSPNMVPPMKRTASEANLSPAKSPESLLPVRRYAAEVAEFLNAKKSASVFIVVGDTGSGKTTQIPQLLTDKILDEFFGGAKRRIAVTQPRRVAAVSVAKRVAEEYGCQIGTDVGYSVRFDDSTTPATKIKYMTDGMLVREAQTDWMLSAYNMVVLDEVHERSLHTDILLALVRKAVIRRKKFSNTPESKEEPLKVLLMSATMDLEKMQVFFRDAPLLYVPGKTFPVEVKFTPNPIDDYTHAAMVAIFQIHRSEPAGDILVFLTGKEEIEDLVRRCRQIATSLPSTQSAIKFVPLYAQLSTDYQMQAINRSFTQNGQTPVRKVIVSTNVAETSITIPGVKFVVDCGRAKNKMYTPATGMEVLKVEKISQAQAWQRTGRAGREQAGICFRLYTEEEFGSWPQHPVPEILRSNLATVLLQIIAMGMDKPLAFPFFARPEEDNLRACLDQLQWIGALTLKELNGDIIAELTNDGQLMAKFPLDPRHSRCILRARTHNCTEEMITIIAMLSCDSPFITPFEKRKEAADIHQKFSCNEGDPLAMLKVWRAFKESKGSRMWFSTNFINQRSLPEADRIRQQLREVCTRNGIPMSSCGTNSTAVRKALCEGLFMNAAEMLPDGSYITLDSKKPVFLHPSSFLFKTKPACVVYNELLQTTKLYIRDLCLVEKDWVDAAGSKYFLDMRKKMAEKSTKSTTAAGGGGGVGLGVDASSPRKGQENLDVSR